MDEDGFSTPARVLEAAEFVGGKYSVEGEVIKERVDECRRGCVCLDAEKTFAGVVDQEDGLCCVKAKDRVFKGLESAAEDGVVSFEVGPLKPSNLHL